MARVGSLKFIKVTKPCLAHSISFISQRKPPSNIKSTLSCSSTAFGLHTRLIPSRLLIFKNFCTTNNNAQPIQPNTENVSQSYVDDNLAKLKLMLKKEKYGSVAGAMFHMRKEKKPLTPEHYKIAIESYSHLRKSKEILNLLEEMSQNNMTITITEYNFLLKSVLMELQDHSETINIKKMIEDAGYKLDAFSYGILMHSAIIGLEHSKHIMESRALLQEMKERRVRPNLQFYEEVIRSYHHRNAKSIIYWYKKMVENGYKPPKDILSIIKNAFIRLGMREELQEFMTNVWNTTDWGEGSGPCALDLANKLDTEFIIPQHVQSQDQILSEEKEAIQMEELTK